MLRPPQGDEMMDVRIFIRLIGDYNTSEKKRAVAEATALICTLKSLESKLFYCSHFPQLLHPLQVGRIPQLSHFSRKYGLYLSSSEIG